MVALLFPMAVGRVGRVHVVEGSLGLVPCSAVVESAVHHLVPVEREAADAAGAVAESCRPTPPVVAFGKGSALAEWMKVSHETCHLPDLDRECPTTPIRAPSFPLEILLEIWEGEAG